MTPPSNHNIPHHGMSRLSTAPKPNMPRRMKHPHSLPNNVSQSRKSQDPLCTTPEQWIQPCQCHSMTLPRSKPRRLKNAGRYESTVGLFSHSPGRRHQISCLRHDIAHPQRRLIPFGFQRTKPPWRSLFLRKKIPRTRYTKRINPQCRCRHQKRDRLRSRIRSWSVISQRPKWCPAQSYTNRCWPHTTPDASPHR
jgi:hypothetical protein